MSLESARAFLKKIQEDEDFKKKLGETDTVEQRMEYTKAAGFDFTKKELDMVQSELDDDDLDAVAGGSWGCGHTHENENCAAGSW